MSNIFGFAIATVAKKLRILIKFTFLHTRLVPFNRRMGLRELSITFSVRNISYTPEG